ncbi:uncharacterized protein [Macrobrachium rosenbergii]|uniref:uncharacterized protein n=1 Tax=Macrobrachium rosenbergii TaxID=79674 RepID=UPI0034D77EFC
MKIILIAVVFVGVALGDDGSYILDSRGVEVEQGLTPSRQLYENHDAFSEDFKQRSQEQARQYTLDQTVYNDPNPRYTWAYAVDAESTGDLKSAREERRGDVVVGQYSVMDPDGVRRTVDYQVAPGTGFRPPSGRRKQTPSRISEQHSQYQSQQNSRNQQQQYQRLNRNQQQNSPAVQLEPETAEHRHQNDLRDGQYVQFQKPEESGISRMTCRDFQTPRKQQE